jgi:hypothetical protein
VYFSIGTKELLYLLAKPFGIAATSRRMLPERIIRRTQNSHIGTSVACQNLPEFHEKAEAYRLRTDESKTEMLDVGALSLEILATSKAGIFVMSMGF